MNDTTGNKSGQTTWSGSLFARTFAILGYIQRIVRAKIVPLHRIAETLPKTERILEIGCGEGLVLQHILPQAEELIGIDIDIRKVEYAKTRFAGCPKVTILAEDAFGFLARVPSGYFNAVLLIDVLSAFPWAKQRLLLRESMRVVTDNGLVIIKAIDGGAGWKTKASRLLSGIVCQGLQLSLSEKQQFRYLHSNTLANMLSGFGAKVQLRHLHRESFHPIPHYLLTAWKKAEPVP